MTSGTGDPPARAWAEPRAGPAAQGRAIAALEIALETSLQDGLNAMPNPSAPASEHRRAHRPGSPPKIAGDPEGQAFIAARIGGLTLHQIAAEIARHFPPERRVHAATIHRWWQKEQHR